MRILAALAIAASLTFAAAPAPAFSVQAADAGRSAAELAKLVHPIELSVASETEGSDRYLVQAMLKQPAMADLDRQYPGITAAMYQAGRPFMIEVARRGAQKVQRGLAALYQAELTLAEIEQARRFFSSATGQMIIRGMFDPAGVEDIAEAVARDPEADIEVQTLSNLQTETAQRMAATATAEDETAAAAFVNSPVGAKLQALRPRVQTLIARIANSEEPDLQQQMESAMNAAAERFMARSNK